MTSAHQVLEHGAVLTLYAVVNEGGDCEAEVWLGELGTAPQTQFKARFQRLTAIGHLGGPEQMHPLECKGDPVVHEIKVHHGPGYRLYVIRDGKDWIATHGRKKPKDKNVCKEAIRARAAFAEYKKRTR